MAVEITLTDIGSGFNRTTINDNFAAIAEAFENSLGRQGTTPNSMNADIDMDSNDLLNVGDINTSRLFVDGEEFVPATAVAVGDKGWSPSFSIVTDGARRVLQLTAYVGGEGDVPTDNIGKYVGATQMETLIANGVDIRGPQGASGPGTGDLLAANNLSDVASTLTSFNNVKQAATDSYSGVVELATVAETAALSDTAKAVVPAGLASLFSGMLYGLTLSNNSTDSTNDIDIATGVAIDSTNAQIIKLTSGLTKRLDAAWSVGTNAGGLDTGSISNTTYHVWLIMRSDTGIVDVLFSTSASSPTMPTDYTHKRRIGSIVRTSGAIKSFTQVGDYFYWNVAVADYSSSPSTSGSNVTLTVPQGVVVIANISASILLSGSNFNFSYYRISPLTETNAAASSSNLTFAGSKDDSANAAAGSTVFVNTNTSGQIRQRSDRSSGTLVIMTNGWIDTRGKQA